MTAIGVTAVRITAVGVTVIRYDHYSLMILVRLKTPYSGIFHFLLEIRRTCINNTAVFVAGLIMGEPWTYLPAFLIFLSPN